MTLAEQNLRDGSLQEALTQLQAQIRKEPANAKLRVFLFQLLSIQGVWDKALTQLNVAGELDASNLAMVQTYRESIRCELFRKAVFAGQKTPLVLGQPNQWMALLIEALKFDANANFDQALAFRHQALELAPTTSGCLDGVRFAWIADADVRLGPVLEAIVKGCYYWIPLQNIQKIQLEKPSDLRDLVWMPAHFTWINGGEAFGLIPTRYPGSENSQDSMICLSRKTEWQEISPGYSIGWGQRLLATDVDDYPLMDIREIEFDAAAE